MLENRLDEVDTKDELVVLPRELRRFGNEARVVGSLVAVSIENRTAHIASVGVVLAARCPIVQMADQV